MKTKLILLAGAMSLAAPLSFTPANAAVLAIAGDADCFGLGGTCPDGTLWQTGLGGVFFTSNAGPGDPAGTDEWNSFVNPSYSLAYSGGAAPFSIQIKTAGIADNRGPYTVFLNGTSIGQITTNTTTNAFQEVRTFNFAFASGLLLANNTVLINTTNNAQGDGFSIDYVALIGTAAGGGVPEPATWAMMIGGFALVGAGLRRRTRQTESFA